MKRLITALLGTLALVHCNEPECFVVMGAPQQCGNIDVLSQDALDANDLVSPNDTPTDHTEDSDASTDVGMDASLDNAIGMDAEAGIDADVALPDTMDAPSELPTIDSPEASPGDAPADVPADTINPLWGTVHQELVAVSRSNEPREGITGYFVSHGMRVVSRDGRYVVFDSIDRDLTPTDVTGPVKRNVYLRDMMLGVTTLISHSGNTPGQGGNGDSFAATISADGSRIAFFSNAGDLEAGAAPSSGGTAMSLFTWTRGERSARLLIPTPLAPTVINHQLPLIFDGDGNSLAFNGGPELLRGEIGPPGIANGLLIHEIPIPLGAMVPTLLTRTPTGGFVPPGCGMGANAFLYDYRARTILFSSFGGNFVTPDTGPCPWMYLANSSGTIRVRPPSPTQSAVSGMLSLDGNTLAIDAPGPDTGGVLQVWVGPRDFSNWELISRLPGPVGGMPTSGRVSCFPRMSDDGSVVLFRSMETRLDPAPTTASVDLYVAAGMPGRRSIRRLTLPAGSNIGTSCSVAEEVPFALSGDGSTAVTTVRLGATRSLALLRWR